MKNCALFEKPTKKVSERMRKIRSSGSKMEKEMEFLLKKLRISYDKQPKLMGHPDFRVKGTNVLIFCDSAFWHGKKEKEIKGVAFSKNKKFWMEKLHYNRRRDARNNRMLRKCGWSVQRFSDSDVLKKRNKVLNRLRKIADAI